MSHYLLSVHSVEGESHPPPDPNQMEQMMAKVNALEARMEAENALVFSGALHGADIATVVRAQDDEVLTTDGPFAEAKEQIAGIYLVDAPDLDKALDWAAQTSDCVGRAIEVRSFQHARIV
ncbi:MAG: hypothetical protein GY724_21760 [Actinomycetia bacterium]|nr:hypothetical protein [Actinomycetes bacterium]MCP5035638.1 hypothetical protein [Actinomycetes bacterium]